MHGEQVWDSRKGGRSRSCRSRRPLVRQFIDGLRRGDRPAGDRLLVSRTRVETHGCRGSSATPGGTSTIAKTNEIGEQQATNKDGSKVEKGITDRYR